MKRILFILCFMFLIVVPIETQAAGNYVFKDINANQSYLLQKLVVEDIIDGTDEKFYPSTAINRLQMATMLYNAYDLKPVRAAKSFSDVSPYLPFAKQIQAVYRAGIMDGDGSKFNPYEPVRRSHVAKVYTNLLKLEQQQTTKFKDVPLTNNYNGYIGALVQANIIQGYADGTFKMTKNVTKMQFATMLYRSLYGKETAATFTRTVKSNKDFAPTKLASAQIRVGFGGNPYTVTMKFNKNGNTNLDNTVAQPYIFYTNTSIRGGQDSSDYIYFDNDLRGLVDGKTERFRSNYGTYFNTLTFNEKAVVAGKTMTGLVKLSHYNSSAKETWNYYLKEGYGVVSITLDGKPMWEILSIKLR